MPNQIFGLSIETWAGVVLGSILVPFLWWLTRVIISWLHSQCPIRLVLQDISKNEETCQIIVSDLQVERHPSNSSNSAWPLIRNLPPRLGGQQYGRGINIPSVWADSDAQAVADILNVLGQSGKKNNIIITKFSEDEGNRNCHLIVVGGQDRNAEDFYAQMKKVYYRMDTKEIYDANSGAIVPRDITKYGYGLILKARNPFLVGHNNGVAFLVGGFGVLGTIAAAYYLRNNIKKLGVQFGNNNFGVIIRAPISTGYQGAERMKEYDRPVFGSWNRIIAWLRRRVFMAK